MIGCLIALKVGFGIHTRLTLHMLSCTPPTLLHQLLSKPTSYFFKRIGSEGSIVSAQLCVVGGGLRTYNMNFSEKKIIVAVLYLNLVDIL